MLGLLAAVVVAGFAAEPDGGSAARYVALALLLIALVALTAQGVREWRIERDGDDELKLP